MTMYDTGISWGRAKPHLKTGAMRADRHLGPEVHSFHPMGLGQDWLKWEIVAKRVSSLAMTATMRGSSCPRSALRSTFPGLAVRHLRYKHLWRQSPDDCLHTFMPLVANI